MQQNKSKKIEVLLPPAVGYSFSILINFFFKNRISFRYYPRLIIIGIINIINMPFRLYERLFINHRFKKEILKDPIFIIGHWRSGTTHLHNLLSKDEQMGYVTTFQGVFPDTIFNKLGLFIFENFTRILIPSTRRGDNVKLNTRFPQEEEFALGDKIPLCYYYFWMFPKNTLKYYDSDLRLNNVSDGKIKKWKKNYKLLISKALKNTNGERLLSKNPPNTSRIKTLLEIFPNAKFIFIHRNPVEVFLSTSNFFNKMMPHLQLQSFTDEGRTEMIFEIYQKMMKDYLADRSLIPTKNLIEIAFEDLEQNPVKILENIYDQLELPGYEKASPLFQNYIQSMKSYQKNKHTINAEKLERVKTEWGFAMKHWNYKIPDNIEVTND